jgi:hypothetical protein
VLRIAYRISDSRIPHAGQGLFATEPIATGRVIVAPDAINGTVDFAYVQSLHDDHPHLRSSVRWFEDVYTVAPDWPDECFLNHSFAANGLWHLGFVFAARNVQRGEEICIDYRFLLAPGFDIGFADALTGRRIVGYSWDENVLNSTQQLLDILQPSSSALAQARP